MNPNAPSALFDSPHDPVRRAELFCKKLGNGVNIEQVTTALLRVQGLVHAGVVEKSALSPRLQNHLRFFEASQRGAAIAEAARVGSEGGEIEME